MIILKIKHHHMIFHTLNYLEIILNIKKVAENSRKLEKITSRSAKKMGRGVSGTREARVGACKTKPPLNT